MSFVVREITKRADGGEIVRARMLAAEEIVVGRGTDCDVQVQDLAVLLRHARLRRVADGRVFVEAMSGVPIEIDGRFGNRGEIRPGSESKVMLGGHRLTIAAPASGDEVSITVERVAPLSEAAGDEDESRIFTLSHTVPSKRRTAWLAALVVLVAFLAYPVAAYFTGTRATPNRVTALFQPDEAWTSGPLSKAHANLDKNCASCHTKAFTAVEDGACITCHRGVADHSTPAKLVAAHADVSFQGKLRQSVGGMFGLEPWTCTTCHKEHEGPGPMPLGFDSDCASCHTSLSTRVQTDLGDAADFKTKHPNFKPFVVALPAPGGADPMLRRVSLDDKPTENSGLKFPHDMHLSASNGVARMARQIGGRYDGPLDCADCHRPDQTGVRFRPIEMERDCAACHSLDFARADGMIRTLRHGDPAQAVAELRDFYRVARPVEAVDRRRPGLAFTATRQPGPGGSAEAKIRAIFQEGGACYDCHVVRAPANPRTLAYSIAPVSLSDRYFTKGWFDHRDHDTAASPCTDCHLAKQSKTSADLLLPGIATCRECHAGDNPHGDEIASPCASCHSYHEGPGAPRNAGSKATVTAAAKAVGRKG